MLHTIDQITKHKVGLLNLGIPTALDRSRLGRGGHVWVFFEEAA